MNTKQKILDFIRDKKEVTAKMIIEYTGLTQVSVHRYLREFVEDDLIEKIGKAPKVIYSPNYQKPRSISGGFKIGENPIDSGWKGVKYATNQEQMILIEDNFVQISPTGKVSEGWRAFVDWCLAPNRGFDVFKSADRYYDYVRKFESLRDGTGLINVKQKVDDTFEQNFMDEVYSLDYYSIPEFGRTRLASYLFFAKQSGDREFINKIIREIKPKILDFVDKSQPDAVGFVPPTISRNVQFMTVLEKKLEIKLPELKLDKIAKVKGNLVVQQKTLKKTEQRIENARETIFVNDLRQFDHILLIDDFIGSGSTLNEIARKIKSRGQAKKITGLGITTSLNGFDVITEV